MKRPISLWLLVFLLLFLSFGGFFGGTFMLLDPSGGALGMDEILPLLPVPDFVLPGFFLSVVMGILPLVLVYGLIWKPNWKWADQITAWSGHYWAWTGVMFLGLVLIVWLGVQGLLIGFQWPIQYITLANGLLILMATIMPGIRRYYERP
jgi:hypothetical protein